MRKLRRRRLALKITGAALTLTAWVYSHWWMIQIEYKFGSAVPPGASNGDPQLWTLLAKREFVSSFDGRITTGIAEYGSLAPSRDQLSGWNSYKGWDALHIPRTSVKPDDKPNLYWDSRTEFSLLGLGTRTTMRQGEESRLITIPYWLPATLLAAVTLGFWLPMHQRNRRLDRGLCIHCGYNLTGTPPPCPECGRDQEMPE